MPVPSVLFAVDLGQIRGSLHHGVEQGLDHALPGDCRNVYATISMRVEHQHRGRDRGRNEGEAADRADDDREDRPTDRERPVPGAAGQARQDERQTEHDEDVEGIGLDSRRVQDVDVGDDQRGRAEGGDGPGIPEPAQREEQQWGAEHAGDERRIGHCR